jgi:hypothetical protein|eukprot:COSAG02_NODE_458_length_21942_cov_1643.812068_18_plen_219_part_00
MVHKVYKELMILGFIQFLFILAKDFRVVHPTKSYTHCFDFSLLLVTFSIFLYVANMVSEAPLATVPQATPATHAFAARRACEQAVSSFGMHISKRSWDRMAMKTTHDVIRELKENLPPDKPTVGQRICLWLDDFVKNTLGIGLHWRTEADFKVVELLFKTKFYLDRTFDYNRYLAFVLEDVVVNLSELVRTFARRPRLFLCIARVVSTRPRVCLSVKH